MDSFRWRKNTLWSLTDGADLLWVNISSSRNALQNIITNDRVRRKHRVHHQFKSYSELFIDVQKGQATLAEDGYENASLLEGTMS